MRLWLNGCVAVLLAARTGITVIMLICEISSLRSVDLSLARQRVRGDRVHRFFVRLGSAGGSLAIARTIERLLMHSVHLQPTILPVAFHGRGRSKAMNFGAWHPFRGFALALVASITGICMLSKQIQSGDPDRRCSRGFLG